MPTLTQLASGAVNVDLDLTMLAHFVLFTAFVVLMKDLIFDPLLKVFDEREKRTAGAIDDARTLDDQAIALKSEYEQRIDEIRRQAAGDREQIRARLKKLQAEMLAEARGKADAKLNEGLGRINQEIDAIRRDLEVQRGSLASQIATRVLGREVRS